MAKLTGIVQGEYGKNIIITLVKGGASVNISSYTSITVEFRGDRNNVTRTASFVTDGTDGQIQFSFDLGDNQNLDWKGTWKGQVVLYKTDELTKSDVFTIEVAEGLD